MELGIFITVLVAAPLSVALGALIRRLAVEPESLPVTAEWIDDLSLDRYSPMLRLLAESDTKYLRSREGYTLKQAHKFRASRCEIIRGYLGWLESDFARIAMAIRILMVRSQQDRPDLAIILIRQKIAFHLGMMAIRMHLLVYRWGLTRVDPSTVMGAFDSLRIELRQMVPISAASRA
jgi:hypothetical protein